MSEREVPEDREDPFPDGRQDDGPSRPSEDGRKRTRAEFDAAFAEITAELGPTDLTPSAVLPGPEDASDHGGPRDFTVAPEPDEGFVPPDPGPLNVSDPFLVSAWVATVGGPIAALLLAIFWSGAPAAAWIICLIAAVIGGGVLTWRLPAQRRRDGDDGAVV